MRGPIRELNRARSAESVRQGTSVRSVDEKSVRHVWSRAHGSAQTVTVVLCKRLQHLKSSCGQVLLNCFF